MRAPMRWRWPTETAPHSGSRRKRPWSPDEIRRMKDFAQSGLLPAEIARALGRSRAATEYKARMYGVKLAANDSDLGRRARQRTGDGARVGDEV